jgi:hypothetical protein
MATPDTDPEFLAAIPLACCVPAALIAVTSSVQSRPAIKASEVNQHLAGLDKTAGEHPDSINNPDCDHAGFRVYDQAL